MERGAFWTARSDSCGLETMLSIGFAPFTTRNFPPFRRHRWLQHQPILGTDEPDPTPRSDADRRGVDFPRRRCEGPLVADGTIPVRAIPSPGDPHPPPRRPFASPRFKRSNPGRSGFLGPVRTRPPSFPSTRRGTSLSFLSSSTPIVLSQARIPGGKCLGHQRTPSPLQWTVWKHRRFTSHDSL